MTPLSDNIALSLDMDTTDKNRVRTVLGDDGKNTMTYLSGGRGGDVDGIPTMKNVPPFTVEITLTPEFIETFTKAFSSMDDKDALFTLVMSKKKQKLEMVLGYKQKNLSDRFAFGNYGNTGQRYGGKPISFNAKHLKEILAANSEISNPTLNVSELGL